MKTIFTDLYNKILEIFQVEKSENTAGGAVDRLQVILMHDRTKLDPLIMNKMREELIDVFSKYVVIDKEKLEIDLTNEGDAAALMLNIPIIRAKTEEELEEIRKQLQEEETKVSDNEEDVDSEEETEEKEEKEKFKQSKEDENIEESEEISEDKDSEEPDEIVEVAEEEREEQKEDIDESVEESNKKKKTE